MLRVAAVVCLLALPILPFAPASAAPPCTPPAQESIALPANHYARGDVGLVGAKAYVSAEIWRESNGAPGLLTYQYRCSDGTVFQPDFFVGRVCTVPNDSTVLCILNPGV